MTSSYLICAVLSLAILIGLLTLCKVISLIYSKTTRNELTLRPYYWLMAYSVLFQVQLILSILSPNDVNALLIVGFINTLKVNCQTMVVVSQTYEWFCLWNMMDFQATYDITTVEVELRKFKPRE